MQAGAMVTLGEAAPGAAMAGARAPVILDMRSVADTAQIGFMKGAKGTLTTNVSFGDCLCQGLSHRGRLM